MHNGALAQLPYYICTLAALGGSLRLFLGIRRGARPRRHLWGAGAFFLLGVGFALLAITAGPAPVVSRGEITLVVRWLFLGGGLLWLGWLGSDFRWSVRLGRCEKDST